MSENGSRSGAETGNSSGKDKEAWERNLLERLAFASLDEQKKHRRWGIFFKLFFAGYLVLLLIMATREPIGEKVIPAGDFAALVELNGIIMADSVASADMIVSGLRDAFKSKAKGVILRTNSPGGSPVQSSYIYNEIQRLREKYPKKPVYAVIGDICASGCYYAVAGVDRIYANPSSIVGSIGVLMDGFGFVETMKKLGVERRLMTAGKNKALLDPFSPLNKKHQKHVQSMLDEMHAQFIDVVREGRDKNLKETPDLFSGLFWTGEQALELGLVDDIGSASEVARSKLGTEEIVDFTREESLLDRFANRIGAAMARTMESKLYSGGMQLY